MRTKYKHTQGLTLNGSGTTWETPHLSQAGCEEPGQPYAGSLLLCGLRLVAASEGYSLLVVPRLVTAVASRYRAWAPERGLSICGAQAALPLGIRDLPEPAIKLIS